MASPSLLMRSEMCRRSLEGGEILQLLCAASIWQPQQRVPLAASRRLVLMLRGTCSKRAWGLRKCTWVLGSVHARLCQPAPAQLHAAIAA